MKRFPGSPTMAVDELGIVRVHCGDGNRQACDRMLLDAVCARGGDVAWGLADDALTTSEPTAHVAHSRRATQGARPRGCGVRVFDDAPTVATENIGPVAAICAADDSRDTCLRELEDQVCLLGGDVLWEVEGPTADGDRQRIRGRGAQRR